MRLLRWTAVAALLLTLRCGTPSRATDGRRPGAPFQTFLRRQDASLIAYTPRTDDSSDAIERELTLLRQKFNGLALYGFDERTPGIFEAAAKLRYGAILGTIWDPRSDAEIRAATDLISRYADRLALAVSIGSEGLLEKRYSIGDLESCATRLDRLVETTTSEPWWRYLDGQPSARALRDFGDFITVHVHVVWDADIRDPAEAARWSRDRGVEIMNLSRRPVLVREAGFPGGGRSPRAGLDGMEFSRESQAAFWREWRALRGRPGPGAEPFVSLAAAFEAIDNPSKTWRDFENSWGLLSSDLQPYSAWNAFADVP